MTDSENSKKLDIAETHRYCGTNNCVCTFASHPKSKYWHPTLNGDVTPGDVAKSAKKKYWFRCNECAHDIYISLSDANRGQWCKYCSHTALCNNNDCEMCFKNSFASHSKSKFWLLEKNVLTPRQVAKTSGTKYWFFCETCTHSFDMRLYVIGKGSWCWYCSPHWKHCIDESCSFCYNKSFASHSKCAFWNKEMNLGLDPLYIAKTSFTKIWFNCEKCKHTFQKTLSDVFQGYWCHYCSEHWKHCGDKDCIFCFDQSFASQDVSKLWDYTKNGNLNPLNISRGSRTLAWFICRTCNHSFEKSVGQMLQYGCKYCSQQWVHCDDKDCVFCFNRSFASQKRAKYWDYSKNTSNPLDVAKSSKRKFYFICDKCQNTIYISLNHITTHNAWCSVCLYKTEKKLGDWLKIKYPNYTLRRHKSFDWCKNEKTNRHFPFDFLLEELNLIVELDGDQHFVDVSGWKTKTKESQERDIYKMCRALKNGFSIVRIYQRDVWGDSNNWEVELTNAIESERKLTFVKASKDFVNKVYEDYEKRLEDLTLV